MFTCSFTLPYIATNVAGTTARNRRIGSIGSSDQKLALTFSFHAFACKKVWVSIVHMCMCMHGKRGIP
jgi:hypothetical protein